MAGLWVCGRCTRVPGRGGLAGEGAGERRAPKLGTRGRRLRRVCLGGVKLASALRFSVGDGLARAAARSGCWDWDSVSLVEALKRGQPETAVGYRGAFSRFLNRNDWSLSLRALPGGQFVHTNFEPKFEINSRLFMLFLPPPPIWRAF